VLAKCEQFLLLIRHSPYYSNSQVVLNTHSKQGNVFHISAFTLHYLVYYVCSTLHCLVYYVCSHYITLFTMCVQHYITLFTMCVHTTLHCLLYVFNTTLHCLLCVFTLHYLACYTDLYTNI
jgi:hypothetical protein